MSKPRLISKEAAAEYLANELGDPTITSVRLYRCSVFGSNGVHLNHMRGHRRRICYDSHTLLQDYLDFCRAVAISLQINAIPREQIAAVVDDLNYSEM